MAISAADILVKISAEGAEGVSAKLKGIGGTLDSTGKTAMKWGAGLTLGVTTPLAMIGKASISMASDVNESISKTGELFGSQADALVAWAGDTTDSLFMSQNAALQYTSSFGGMISNMGLTNEEMAGMSKTLTTLTGDFASFHNLNDEGAFTVIASALAGETEAIRRYGVDVSAAAVEQRALEMGLADTAGQLTENDKKLARYNIIMEETSAAHGDAARTAGGFANTQRAMQEQLAVLSVSMGNILLPIAIKLTSGLAKLFKGFEMFPKSVKTGIVVFGALAAAIGPLLTVFGALAVGAGVLLSPFVLIGAAIGFLVIKSGLLSAAIGWLRETFDKVRLALNAFNYGATVFQMYLENLPGPLQSVVILIIGMRDAFGDLMDVWQALKECNLSEVFDELKEALDSTIGPLQDFASAIGEQLVDAFESIDWGALATALWDGVSSVINAVNWGVLLSSAAGALISGASALINGIRAGAEAAWPYVSEWLNQIPGLISEAVGIGWDFLKDKGVILVQSLLDGLSQAWPGVYAWLSLLPGFVAEALGTFGAFMLEKGSALLSDLLTGLISQWPTVYAWLSGLGGFMLEAIGSLAELLVSRGAEALWGLVTGIIGMWPTVYAWLAGLGGFMFDAVGSLARTLRDRGLKAIAGVYDGVLDKWASLKGWLMLLGTSMYIAVGDLSRFLRDKGLQAISGVYDGVLDKWVSLKSWLAGLRTFMALAVGYLGGVLYSAGSDLMNGLKSGIANAGQSVLDTIAGWASKIKDTFKSMLSISSPSRVFAYYGEMLGTGFVEGMTSSISAIQTAASGMASATAISLSNRNVSENASGLSGSITPGIRSAPVVVNHNYLVTPDELVKLMQDAEAGGNVARNLATELRYW